MSELDNNDRVEKALRCKSLVAMVRALCDGENDEVSLLANCASIIHSTMGYFWTGFYMVRPCIPHSPLFECEELRLGPFQGPVACTRIGYGKGVCGSAWKDGMTIMVPDVDEFPGHIACSSLSRSEIVVPILRSFPGKTGKIVAGVLDIDSEKPDFFDELDKQALEEVCGIISEALYG